MVQNHGLTGYCLVAYPGGQYSQRDTLHEGISVPEQLPQQSSVLQATLICCCYVLCAQKDNKYYIAVENSKYLTKTIKMSRL